MRLYYIALLVLLFITPLSFAQGQTVYAEDFSKNPIQLITLGEKDRLSFNLLSIDHTIIVDRVYDDAVDLAVFKNKTSVMYLTVNPQKYARLDYNTDLVIDLLLGFDNVDKDTKQVSLILKKVEINLSGQKDTIDLNSLLPKEDSLTSEAILEAPQKPNRITGLIILLSIVAIGTIVYFIFYKK